MRDRLTDNTIQELPMKCVERALRMVRDASILDARGSRLGRVRGPWHESRKLQWTRAVVRWIRLLLTILLSVSTVNSQTVATRMRFSGLVVYRSHAFSCRHPASCSLAHHEIKIRSRVSAVAARSSECARSRDVGARQASDPCQPLFGSLSPCAAG